MSVLFPEDALPTLVVDGLKFKVATNAPNIELKKSIAFNEWNYECPMCKQKITISMNDVRNALRDQLFSVQLFQNVAVDSTELKKQKDFLSYLITFHKILKKHSYIGVSELGKMQKAGYNYKEISCSNCTRSVHIDFSVEAPKDNELPFWPYIKGNVKNLTDEQKEKITAMYEIRGSEDIDKLFALGESGWMIPIVQKLPFGSFNGLEFKIRWADYGKNKTPQENAKEFADNIVMLLKDIKDSSVIMNEISAFSENRTDKLSSEQGKIFIYDLTRHLRMGLPNLERKLLRMIIDNLIWLNEEIEHLVETGRI